MNFEDFATSRGYDTSTNDHVGLATVAIAYTKLIKLPNICSFSSFVFTHGSPRFDPSSYINRRFYSAPSDVLKIAPHVAEYHSQKHEQHWFEKDTREGLMDILSHAAVSWLLFAINPQKYSGDTGHLVGVRNDSPSSLSIWDTTRSRPYVEMNHDETWDMCLSHMYGPKPLVVSFT